MLNGNELKKEAKMESVSCIKGKQARDLFSSSSSIVKGLLDLVHAGVFGPIKIPSVGRSRNFLTFADDASRKVNKFWAEAVSTAAYLVKRCSTRSMEVITPEEAWSQRKTECPTPHCFRIKGNVPCL